MAFQFRAFARLAAPLLVASLLSGCGSLGWFGGDEDPTPPTKLADIRQQVTVNKIWSERPTRGAEGKKLYLVPAFAAGRVYVADNRGRLVALAADSGRELWRRDTKLPLSGGPDVLGDRLVLGTSQAQLVAFSTTDGKQLWRTQLGSEVLSEPRFTQDGKIIVHTLDDTVYGIDAASGKELWRTPYPAPVLTLRGSSSPTLTPTGVAVGLSGGKLVSLDTKDGMPLWETLVSQPSGRSELARIADIDADPVLVGDILYVGTYNGDLAAVNSVTGQVLWRRELSAHAGLTADANSLFVTDSQDQVWGASIADGAGRWKQEDLRYRQLTAPTLVGNLVAVGDYQGYLHLLNKTDGRIVGRVRINKKGIIARPLLAGGRLYVYGIDGTLAALSLGKTAATLNAAAATTDTKPKAAAEIKPLAAPSAEPTPR